LIKIYITAVTSPRGLNLGILDDVNCKDYQLDNVYLLVTRDRVTEFSGGLKNTNQVPNRKLLCWYYGCNIPKDPKEEIQIFYFFEKHDQSDRQDWLPVPVREVSLVYRP
jgi:hypothetical protein